MKYITLENITFSYENTEEPVLSDFSLSIDRGECIVFQGDNGSGKTTLFRIFNGLSFPQNGNYYFDGTPVTKKYLADNVNMKQFHKDIGYLFQNPDTMLFNGSVYDEIAFGPRQMGKSDAEVDRIVTDCMNVFDIGKLRDKAPYHLSFGQKKKVAFASVMALNPSVLVLDEPMAGLDVKTQEWLTAFLLELKKAGKTLLISTHERVLVNTIADEVVVLGLNRG